MAVAKENKLVRGNDLYYVGQRIKENFAAKEDGKGLSTNDYTTDEKTKLAGIESGAQKNVKPDWNAASGDAQILNKPSIPSKTSDLTNDSGFVTSDDIPEGVQPATANPLMDGAAAIGSSAKYAKEDHVHPSDSSKADKATTLAGYGITNAYTKAEIDTAISNKQDTISDLPAIRSGAALGSTSVQPVDIEDMVEAEPIGSIIPPVNPSEFATKEELSQLGQKVNDILSDYTLIQYANLFDKTAATSGAAVRKDNGNLYTSANDYYSDYIAIPSGATAVVMSSQTYGGVKGWACYNSSKTFTHGGVGNVITFQSGDVYFRTTVNGANIDTTMIVVGSSSSDLPSEYIPYGSAWERKPIPGADLTDDSVTIEKLADESVTKEKIGQSVWDEVMLLTSEKTNPPIDYTYSNYILASATDNRYIVALNGYDVVIYYVGNSKKFHIKGTCANGYTGCALLAERFSGITKLFNVAGGGYDYYGETTATQPYIAISVAQGTEFSCEVITAVAEAVEEIEEKVQDVRPVIHIYKTDTEVEILTKLIDAYTNGNTDVIWENGTYIFAEVYQYMISELGWSWTMELPIGNNCRYYFNGSTLISNQPSGTYEESRNIFGCKAGSSNKMDYELYDGILINNGGTYCVHDECARGTNPYIHKYVNMRMYYNKVEGLTQTISKCIGGGCGVNGTVIIDNCIFVSDATNVEVSWHGKQNEENPVYFALFVDGCYFGRGLAISSHFKTTDKVFVKYSNNVSRDALAVDSTPESEVYAFNNSTHE